MKLILGLIGVVGATSCGGISTSTGDDETATGKISMHIDVRTADGSSLRWNSPVSYSIVGAKFNHTGSLSANNQSTLLAIMESIPVGDEYAVTLQSSAAGQSCDGGAMLAVSAMQTTSVALVLQCHR